MTDSPIQTGSSRQVRISTMEMHGIVKRFPGVLANDHIDFDVKSGEVHALLGENGAGKSTLMKILYGMYRPDAGEICLNGKPIHITSPVDSIELGIGMIHQHFMLVPTLTVAENVALGLPSSRGAFTDIDRVSARITQLAEVYGLQVDPGAYVWQLAVGQQQRVEILKALYRGADLLILDEPTAVLTPQEVVELFSTLRQMTREGHALIFISHKLHEVIEISHRVTVLRDGKVVGAIPTSATNKTQLAQMMVGREFGLKIEKIPIQRGEVRLEVKDLRANSDRGTVALRGVNLQIYSGEILGLAGVSGNGQRELAEVISGLREATKGQVILNSKDVTGSSAGSMLKLGLSYVPEERMRDGMIRDFTVSENLILREHNRPPYSRSGFLEFRSIARNCDELIKRFNVKTPSQDTPVKSLSGGNIQKLILARELSRQPNVLVAAQPTRGLDIGATNDVHQLLLEQRSHGIATLLISEDLEEILSLSDRIAVIYEGQIMDIVDQEQATPENIGLLMAGIRPEGRNASLSISGI